MTKLTSILCGFLFLFTACDDGGTKVADPVCGNGIVETGEACDGDDFAGMTCESFGQPAGTLACSAGCTLDLTGCRALNVCGDGIRDPDEPCDGDDFGTMTCESFGMEAGDLVCTETCTIDASACHEPDVCGNGIVEDGEACDGEDFGSFTCTSFGFDEGTLTCTEACTLDLSNCGGYEPRCGNGVLDTGEECDGDDLGDVTCDSIGHDGGVVSCLSVCILDFDGCTCGSNQRCIGSLGCCNGSCIDIQTDTNNCGGCGSQCSAYTSNACVDGTCACGSGTECQGGRRCCTNGCKDTSSDVYNCGSCGNACGVGLTCSGGQCFCGSTPCVFGESCCGDYCANLTTDPTNCGECGNDCGNGNGCSNGDCTCGTSGQVCRGEFDCGFMPGMSTCTEECCPTGCAITVSGDLMGLTAVDPHNCGECGNDCGANICCCSSFLGSGCSCCSTGQTCDPMAGCMNAK